MPEKSTCAVMSCNPGQKRDRDARDAGNGTSASPGCAADGSTRAAENHSPATVPRRAQALRRRFASMIARDAALEPLVFPARKKPDGHRIQYFIPNDDALKCVRQSAQPTDARSEALRAFGERCLLPRAQPARQLNNRITRALRAKRIEQLRRQ